MISDDPDPAVAWAPPTKKTPYISRLGNQAINPVGKAHATIRSSITRPTRRRGGFIRQGSFFVVFSERVLCFYWIHVHPP